jgi:hypothetical protein
VLEVRRILRQHLAELDPNWGDQTAAGPGEMLRR